MGKIIEGLLCTPLKILPSDKGNVMHCMKVSSKGFQGFGECYFSCVNKDVVKGWKKHIKMTLNLSVIKGEIQFVIFDDREESTTKGTYNTFKLSLNNYQRLTIPPGVWVAFKGLGEDNMLINVANLEHSPEEAVNVDISTFEFLEIEL